MTLFTCCSIDKKSLSMSDSFANPCNRPRNLKHQKLCQEVTKYLMLRGRGSYIQYIVDMLILYTLYTTVYTVNMNFILHNGGILENHYQ